MTLLFQAILLMTATLHVTSSHESFLLKWVPFLRTPDSRYTLLESKFFKSFSSPDEPVDLLSPRKSGDTIWCILNIRCCIFPLRCTDCVGCDEEDNNNDDDSSASDNVEWSRLKDPGHLDIHSGPRYVVYDSRYYPHTSDVKGAIYYELSDEDCAMKLRRVVVLSNDVKLQPDDLSSDIQTQSVSSAVTVVHHNNDIDTSMNLRHEPHPVPRASLSHHHHHHHGELESSIHPEQKQHQVKELVFEHHRLNNGEAFFYLELSGTCDHTSVNIILGIQGMKTRTSRS